MRTMTKAMCAVAVLAAGQAAPVFAAKIVVEDSRCKQLDAANLAAVEKKLKDSMAIAAGDTLECKVPPGSTASQKNFPLTTLLPAFNALFCRQKNSDTLAACGQMADKAAREACEKAEKSRFSGVRKAC